MMNLDQSLTEWIRAAFRKALPSADATGLAAVTVVPSASEEFGEFQCNHAMALGKAVKQPPRKIAEAVVAAAQPHEAVDSVSVAGPGFINIRLKTAWLGQYADWAARDARCGVPEVGNNRTVVMDYGSPNITKPLHIGHLRSHNIGSAIDRLHRFLGYHVVADNHLGDWGTQFGITILGYRQFGNVEAMKEQPLEELERVYVKSYERGEQDTEWREQCRRELVKLQAGDPENFALWQEFVRLSIAELERIYVRLGVRYDTVRGESHYRDKLAGAVEKLERTGMARESEGATVVFLDDEKLPPCIVRKRDGGFNYATSDIATVDARVSEYRPDRILYVTDERQQLHFKQVFAICRKLGHTVRLDHVWFGLMRLPEGTFSTREGNVIKLELLLDDAERRALEVVRKGSPDMPEERQREVARAVGIGAVKYADLSQNPQSVVTFTWEKALSLEGNSAPYLQYACARIASVLDKYTEQYGGRDPSTWPIVLAEPIERSLAVKVLRFSDTVLRAAETYKPSALADYLYELAQLYSTFYQNVPFLKAPEGVRESRVRLCGLVAKVLRQGLQLLGIETPERI